MDKEILKNEIKRHFEKFSVTTQEQGEETFSATIAHNFFVFNVGKGEECIALFSPTIDGGVTKINLEDAEDIEEYCKITLLIVDASLNLSAFDFMFMLSKLGVFVPIPNLSFFSTLTNVRA